MTQFIILFYNIKGEFIKESRKGTYEWATKEKILSQKNLFPDVPEAIKIIEKGKFVVLESKFIQKDEKFVGFESTNLWNGK